MKNKTFMPEFKSIFKNELKNFINYKRSIGYDYNKTSCNCYKKLDNFFVEIKLIKKQINQDIIDKWMQNAKGKKQNTRGAYFSTISKFCKYLRILNYEDIVEPDTQNIRYKSNFIPYIYSEAEIEAIINAISMKIKKHPEQLKYKSFKVIFILFYCCGLRHSEALNIKLKHFDVLNRKIVIENSKNNVTREILLSYSVFTLLNNYIMGNHYNSNEDYVFLNNNKMPMKNHNDYYVWEEIKKKVKLPLRYDDSCPRLHDLRHTFAVNSLKQMEKKGFDLYTSLPILSTYLGHKSLTETEYYLRLAKNNYKDLENKIQAYTKEIYGKKKNFYE